MSARLEQQLHGLHPWLAAKSRTLLGVYPGRCRDAGLGELELEIVATTRTLEEQSAAFKAGRSALDGVHRWSLHQYTPALACDLCPVQGIEYLWTDSHPMAAARWDLLGQLAEETGLEWGGRWRHPHDAPHVQVPLGHRVQLLQQALVAQEQDPGPIDGVLGPRTLAALRAVEQAAGLALTERAMWWSIRPASWAAAHEITASH